MNAGERHTHVDVADLVRLVDGELDEPEAGTIRQALEACDVCRDHELRTRRRAARLALVLADSDPAPPPADAAVAALHAAVAGRAAAAERAAAASRATAEGQPAARPVPGAGRGSARRRTGPGGRTGVRARRWLAAGIALVVLGSILVSTPAAAWIARAVERVWSAVTAGAPAHDPGPGATAEPAAERVYEYVPAAGVLDLSFPAGSSGVLRLDTVESATLRLTAAGAAAPEVLLMPSQVRVGGEIGATHEFRVALPPQVDAVRVRVGTGPAVLLSRNRIGAGMNFDLR
jgi:hypothetical protein